MKKQGEFLFKSFGEALKFVKAPTNYEKERNITLVSSDRLIDKDNIKLVSIKKSDKSSTLIIFFKNSKLYDIWKFWVPSQEQIWAMFDILKLFYDNDLRNLKVKFDEERKINGLKKKMGC